MNKQWITAMLAAAAFTGFVQTIAAQENIDPTQPNDATSEQKTEAQKPLLVETFAPIAITPPPAVVQPAEKFLSDLKVYPTF